MHVIHVERCVHIMVILKNMNVFTQVLSRMHVLRVEIMFTHNGHIKMHERIHTGVKPYAYTTCGNMFIHNSDLKMHERINTGITPYACLLVERCSHIIAILKSMNVFTQVKRHNACSTCGKSFATNSQCKYHEKIHMAARPYACSTCGKMFTQNCHLRRHERIHTCVTLYACSTCGKMSTRHAGLRLHEKTHAGERHVLPAHNRTITRFFELIRTRVPP